MICFWRLKIKPAARFFCGSLETRFSPRLTSKFRRILTLPPSARRIKTHLHITLVQAFLSALPEHSLSIIGMTERVVERQDEGFSPEPVRTSPGTALALHPAPVPAPFVPAAPPRAHQP
jgi:hypothetical protein